MQGWSSWTGALVLGPLLGGLLVWLMVRPRQRSLVRRLEDCDGQRQQAVLRAEALSARCEAAEAGRSEASARQARLEEEREDWRRRCQELEVECQQLRTTLREREASHREQQAQLASARESLSAEFRSLAHQIFEERGRALNQSSQAGLEALLRPFREQIEGFQRRINAIHDTAVRGQADLRGEIRRLAEAGLAMSAEAHHLTTALKGESHARGAWGEAQLERTLELSGLVADLHYTTQSSFRDAGGRRRQADLVIRLPDGKHLVIDSKVSLVAYERMVSAADTEQRHRAAQEHVRAVRRHVDELAAKDYAHLVGIHSPGLVLMFMPVEPAYIEALKGDGQLFEYAFEKGVVLVSHTTLAPILRTVSNLWMLERSNREAREMGEHAGEIYNQVALVAERLARLGQTLNTASGHYNGVVTALAGRQGLYGKVERFEQLSTRIRRSLPELEPRHLDFETDRLEPGEVAQEAESPP